MADQNISINLINESGKSYRQYFFLSDSEDIKLRIFNHTMNFIKCCDLPKEDIFPLLNNHLTSLCHKVNMVKYHLRRYTNIEDDIINKLQKDLTPSTIAEGVHLIEKAELTAEYESFLFQMKSVLDILVGFLNPFYRKKTKKNLLKKQVSFENKGINVIKSIETYLKRNPEDEKYLKNLVEYLKRECTNTTKNEDGSLNWLFTIIDRRDEIMHLSKNEHFAFQVNNIGKKLKIYPPRLAPNQTMKDSFKIAYGSVIIFIEDFIALLLTPYLNNNFVCFTYEPEEVRHGSPRWYIMLKSIQSFGLKSIRENPYIITELIDSTKIPISSSECVSMHIYYNSFYK